MEQSVTGSVKEADSDTADIELAFTGSSLVRKNLGWKLWC